MALAARSLLSFLILAAGAGVVAAQSTPLGVWKTIDDETKKEKSLVRISASDGTLSGRIEKLLDPATPPDAVCRACSGELKDRPILGMSVIRGVRASERDPALWEGGEILDPNNGKVYRVRLQPVDGGSKLEVRGYIGTPLLGRTQTWIRVE